MPYGEATTEQRLLQLDFDGTVAHTNVQHEGIISVAEAYELAVDEIFGLQALEHYLETGGLRNDAPGEVVLRVAPDLDSDPDELLTKTNELVAAKVGILVAQVSMHWPEPVEGFPVVWLAAYNRPMTTRAIISSGHTDFMNRVFDVWGLPHADITVSDDEVRTAETDVPYKNRMKPNPFALEWAMRLWEEGHIKDCTLDDLLQLGHVVYAGDDPIKDGQMAIRAMVPFVHIDPQDSLPGYRTVDRMLRLGARHELE